MKASLKRFQSHFNLRKFYDPETSRPEIHGVTSRSVSPSNLDLFVQGDVVTLPWRRHPHETPRDQHKFLGHHMATIEVLARLNMQHIQRVCHQRHARAAWEEIRRLPLQRFCLDQIDARWKWSNTSYFSIQGIIRLEEAGDSGLEGLNVLLPNQTLVDMLELCKGYVGQGMVQDCLGINESTFKQLLLDVDGVWPPTLAVPFCGDFFLKQAVLEESRALVIGCTYNKQSIVAWEEEMKRTEAGRRLLKTSKRL